MVAAENRISLFDTHCHFDFQPFIANFKHELQLAKDHGVERFLVPSIGMSNWGCLRDLTVDHKEIVFALGFHPHFLNDYHLDDLFCLETELKKRPKQCVAVGECGLDFAIDIEPMLQESFLIRQVQLANQAQLPIILHCRNAHNRMIQLLKKHKPQYGGVLHGFSGSYQQAMTYVQLGFHIGVGGVITYPRANKTRQAIARLPLTALVLETDAPDMPLYGHQGKPNHPKNIISILEALIFLRNESQQTVASQLWENSHSLFTVCE